MHALAMAGFGCVREGGLRGARADGAAAEEATVSGFMAVERTEVLGWRPDGGRRVKCTRRAGGGCSRGMEEGLRLGAADAKRVPKGKGGGLAALGWPATGACGREGRSAAPWSALSWEEGPRQSASVRRGHTRGGDAEEGAR